MEILIMTNETDMIDPQEYEELYPEESDFQRWMAESEQIASITVNLERDRFLFDQDDHQDEFSPYNTCNS